MNPYYVWAYTQISFVVLLILSLGLLLLINKGLCAEKVSFVLLLFILIFIYKLLIGASYLGSLAFAVALSTIFSLNDKLLFNVFKKIKFILALMLLPAIALWLLHHSIDKNLFYLGAVLPDLIPDQAKVELGEGYALYPFTVVLDYMLNDNFYRMSGPFDEPGFVGTIVGLILVVSRFNHKSMVDLILLVAGILSFSLAFYIIVFIYLFLISFKSLKVASLLILFTGLLLTVANKNDTIKSFTLDRVQITDEGFSGNNRSGQSLDTAFNHWLGASGYEFMFGVGGFEPDGSSSIKQIPVYAGVVGISLFFLIFIYTLIFYQKKLRLNLFLLAFISIFLLSMTQRPDVAPIYYVIFLVGIMHSRLHTKTKLIKTKQNDNKQAFKRV